MSDPARHLSVAVRQPCRCEPHVRSVRLGAHLQPVEASHQELLRAFAPDSTLDLVDEVLDRSGYRTHEFGDSIMLERHVGFDRPSRPAGTLRAEVGRQLTLDASRLVHARPTKVERS